MLVNIVADDALVPKHHAINTNNPDSNAYSTMYTSFIRNSFHLNTHGIWNFIPRKNYLVFLVLTQYDACINDDRKDCIHTQLCLIHSDYVLLMSQSNRWHKALWVIFIQGNIHGQSFKDILYHSLFHVLVCWHNHHINHPYESVITPAAHQSKCDTKISSFRKR